jgi:FixJ family two-component response regulator
MHSKPLKERNEIRIFENAPNPKVQRFRERHHKRKNARAKLDHVTPRERRDVAEQN